MSVAVGRRTSLPGLALHRAQLMWALVAAMAIGGALIARAVSEWAGPRSAPISVPWWLLAALFYLAEVRVVHIQFQREAHSFTLSEVPLVLGLFFAAPTDVVLACVVGSTAGLLIHRRPAPVKLAFNAALFLLAPAAAAFVFRAVGASSSPLDPLAWLAAFAAAGTSTVVGLACVNAAIWLAQGRSDRARLGLAVRFGLAVAATNACLAMIAVTLIWIAPAALWLLAFPTALAAVAWRSYRAHIREREQRESLELLYDATRILHGGAELEDAVVALLREARDTFRAEVAALVLFTGDGHEHGLRTAIGPGDQVESMASVPVDPELDALGLRAVAEGAAFLAPPLGRGEARPDRVAGVPVHDAMVAPLTGERSLIGTFVIANRQGTLGTFRLDELRLFEALADHAGIALENGRLGASLKQLSELKERLRHQALHDPLTGLGNRALFLERLRAALDRRRPHGSVPVVLFADLDDFKSVNDSLGHAAGDDLLRAVAAAIHGAVRPADLAVRLGGDEFAVLLEDGRDIAAAIRIGERIIDAIGRPVELDGRWVTPSASVGIAAARSGRQTADELLRDADVAMYTAKSRGKGRFAVFDPMMETELSERQQLREDLAGAVARGQLSLRYQPVTELRTGDVMGVEALVRWAHPSRGELLPADFIPIAEESGLIVSVGRWILREACRQAVAWGFGPERRLTMSVNVSVHQLMQPDYVDDVAGVLRVSGLPADRLMLEFAEGQVMTEDPRIASRLRDLRGIGVSLAIDGFGSGFSSVRYLGRYPVDVIKIARPVVATMSRTEDDARIARAIVALGHSLELLVVAEGIESPAQLERARTMQCDRAQGFLLSRPLEAETAGRVLGLGQAAA